MAAVAVVVVLPHRIFTHIASLPYPVTIMWWWRPVHDVALSQKRVMVIFYWIDQHPHPPCSFFLSLFNPFIIAVGKFKKNFRLWWWWFVLICVHGPPAGTVCWQRLDSCCKLIYDLLLFSGLALHADYMANMSVLGSRMGELHHSPSLLGSTELPFSLDGERNLLISLWRWCAKKKEIAQLQLLLLLLQQLVISSVFSLFISFMTTK